MMTEINPRRIVLPASPIPRQKETEHDAQQETAEMKAERERLRQLLQEALARKVADDTQKRTEQAEERGGIDFVG